MQTTARMNALDMDRIRDAVAQAGAATGDIPAHVGRLLDRLGQAIPCRPVEVPPNLVTMNSLVRTIDLDTGAMEVYALRYKVTRPSEPWEATAVAVDSELGSELLGRHVGDTVEFTTPEGTTRLRIAALDYQPERSGRLTL